MTKSVIDKSSTKKVLKNRKLLAQIIAGAVNSLQFINVGTGMNYSTVLLAGLSAGDDHIKPSDAQLSWLGSVVFIFQAAGSIGGGLMVDPIGRKKAIMVANLPYIVAWILMWLAQDIATVVFANALLGLGTGLIKSPVLAFLGETCEPSVRGVLVAGSSVFTSSGLLLIYLLGTFFSWRTSAAVCLVVPFISLVMMLMVPETPIWLLANGRKDEALRSLCWLRGWVDSAEVQSEFHDLVVYNENSTKCRKCDQNATECSHKSEPLWERIKDSFRELSPREARRPLILGSLYFFFMSLTGHTSMKPNIINVFLAFNISMNAHWASVALGVIAVFAALLCMFLVKVAGKRPVVLFFMTGSAISSLLLAIYAQNYLLRFSNTYGRLEISGEKSTTSLILLFSHITCNAVGIFPVSWIIISEIFPYRTRGISCGISTGINFIMSFIVAKTNLDLENALHIHGSLYFYTAVTLVGVIYIYLALPETENRSYEQIEADFANKDKIIFADDCVYNSIKYLFSSGHQKTADLPDIQCENGGICNKYTSKSADMHEHSHI